MPREGISEDHNLILSPDRTVLGLAIGQFFQFGVLCPTSLVCVASEQYD